MQIRRILFENAFQHRALDISLSPFTVIIGKNGSGKSNFIETIGHNLTGEFTLPGKNETMVSEGAASGSSTLWLDRDGVEFVSKASLGKANRSLKSPSFQEALTKSSEVMDYLRDAVLCTPFSLVNTSSILRQGRLETGLFDTQISRATAFTRLAGLHELEQVRRRLEAEATKFTPSTISGDIESVRTRLNGLLADITATQEKRAQTVQQVEAGAAQYETNRQAMAAHEVLAKSDITQDAAVAKIASLQTLIQQADSAIAVLSATVQSDTAALAATAADAESARQAITMFSAADAAWKKYVAETQAIQALEQSLSGLVVPQAENLPALASMRDNLAAQIAGLEAKFARCATDSRSLQQISGNNGNCPMCHSTLSLETVQTMLNALAAEMQQLEVAVGPLRAQLMTTNTDIKTLEAAVSKYAKDKAAVESALQSRRATIVQAAQPTSPENAFAILNHIKDMECALAASKRQLDQLSSTRAKADVELKLTTERLDELRRMTASISIHFDPTFAANQIKLYEALKATVSECDGTLTALNDSVEKCTAELVDIEEKTQRYRKVMEYVGCLNFARKVLHVNEFPSAKVNRFITKMLVSANSYLETMEAGFTMAYDAEAGFIATFTADAKVMRADRLSGGERVVFALAFRFAVNELCSSTGFLILDEPTVWLDSDHVDLVVNALSLVRRRLTPRVQVIVVTHEERLMAAAETVVRIGM